LITAFYARDAILPAANSPFTIARDHPVSFKRCGTETMRDHDKFLTGKEASDLLGITTRGLRMLRYTRKGPLLHSYRRAHVYRFADLVSWALRNPWVLDIAGTDIKDEAEKLRSRLRAA
jgi:hypothetical protein